MKKLTLAEWEKKYIVGPVERFDQKCTASMRVYWDPEIKRRIKDRTTDRFIKSKAGYTLQDYVLRWASWIGAEMELLNTSKPNPSRVSKAIMEVIAGLNPRMRALTYKPPEEAKIDVSDPQTITRDIKRVATYFGADLVGICRLDRRWVYSHTYDWVEGSKPQEIPEEFQYAVVMGFEIDYNMVKYFPTHIADAATSIANSRMVITNAYLSKFIRGLGFKAIDCSVNDVALYTPMAAQAGLGEPGRTGLLITPQFGSRVRLSSVITDLPLIPDAPIDFGVTEFCTVCKKCAEMCPSGAIMPGERTAEPNNISNVAGELKWQVDTEKCHIHALCTNKRCATCIACCPYNKPDTWFHRTVRWFADNARWSDSFLVKMDNLLGYGKPKKADNFWEEWQPRRH